jgi:hypothetical protein
MIPYFLNIHSIAGLEIIAAPDHPKQSVSQSDRNETLDVSPVVRIFEIP